MNAQQSARLVWVTVLLGYFVAVLALALTGSLARFIPSRLVPGVVLAAGALGLIAVATLFGAEPDRPAPDKGFLVFLIPVLFVLLGVRYSGPPAGAFLGLDASTIAAGFESAGWSPSSLPLPLISSQQPGTIPREVSGVPGDPSIIEMERLDFGEELFFRYYSLLYERQELFEGTLVVLRGFTGREPSFDANRFYLARRLLWCCSLDATLLPVVVEIDRSSLPREGVWVEIEAIVDSTRFSGATRETDIPLLRATSIRQIVAPEFEYVFAF